MTEREMLNLFTELTPGGSEFANDPKRCVDYAKDRMRKQWEMILSRQRRIKELERELADRPWKRIEGNVPAEVSQSYYVPEAGDDASNSYSVLLSSNGIAFDSYHSLNIEGMFEIVQIVYEGDDTP